VTTPTIAIPPNSSVSALTTAQFATSFNEMTQKQLQISKARQELATEFDNVAAAKTHAQFESEFGLPNSWAIFFDQAATHFFTKEKPWDLDALVESDTKEGWTLDLKDKTSLRPADLDHIHERMAEECEALFNRSNFMDWYRNLNQGLVSPKDRIEIAVRHVFAFYSFMARFVETSLPSLAPESDRKTDEKTEPNTWYGKAVPVKAAISKMEEVVRKHLLPAHIPKPTMNSGFVMFKRFALRDTEEGPNLRDSLIYAKQLKQNGLFSPGQELSLSDLLVPPDVPSDYAGNWNIANHETRYVSMEHICAWASKQPEVVQRLAKLDCRLAYEKSGKSKLGFDWRIYCEQGKVKRYWTAVNVGNSLRLQHTDQTHFICAAICELINSFSEAFGEVYYDTLGRFTEDFKTGLYFPTPEEFLKYATAPELARVETAKTAIIRLSQCMKTLDDFVPFSRPTVFFKESTQRKNKKVTKRKSYDHGWRPYENWKKQLVDPVSNAAVAMAQAPTPENQALFVERIGELDRQGNFHYQGGDIMMSKSVFWITGFAPKFSFPLCVDIDPKSNTNVLDMMTSLASIYSQTTSEQLVKLREGRREAAKGAQPQVDPDQLRKTFVRMHQLDQVGSLFTSSICSLFDVFSLSLAVSWLTKRPCWIWKPT
jgi:hypothetical protein